MAADAYAALDGADALVILTEWNEFRALDLDRVKASHAPAARARSAQRLPPRRDGARPGSAYHSIGRNPVNGPPLATPTDSAATAETAATAANNGASTHAAGV